MRSSALYSSLVIVACSFTVRDGVVLTQPSTTTATTTTPTTTTTSPTTTPKRMCLNYFFVMKQIIAFGIAAN